MRALFFLILSLVFLLVNLIAPKSFQYNTESVKQVATATAGNADQDVAQISRYVPDQSAAQVTAVRSGETETVPATPAPQAFSIVETNPAILFGEPKNIDNFDRGSSGFGINAGLNDDEGLRIIALNNRISLEPKKNNGWLSWRLRPPAVKDGAAEMEFSIATCARGDRTGLIMHAPDYNSGHGYYFSLACEGTVSILRDSDILGTADAQELFRNTSGDTNKLAAVVRGNKLTVLLNDEAVLSVEDSTYAEGYSGFFTAPQNQDTLTMDIMTFSSYYGQ